MNGAIKIYQEISFPHTSAAFNGAQAHSIAVLIGSAYAQFKIQQDNKKPNVTNAIEWLPPSGYTLIQEFTHNNEFFGFVAQKGREAFIIIRGTRLFYEWINNLKLDYEQYRSNDLNWGSTHRGFLSIYKDIRIQINTVLQQLMGCERIFVAGHSLGGALATLTIPDLLSWGIPPDKITVYTFASPRCGNSTFIQKLEEKKVQHWRIANTEDIVPTLPGATATLLTTAQDEGLNIRSRILNMYRDFKQAGMQPFAHIGTPIYFTISTDSMEDNHNLETIYMKGIGQLPATVP